MTKYFIQGQGEIHLTRADFKAQGGEGAIYVKGATAFKIYADPRRVISLAKIAELSVLTQPNFIRPLDLLLDGKNRPVGYSMRHVAQAYALCQLFPKAFRQRQHLTPETALRLVRKLQAGVCHVHAQGLLIVDLNEMNLLVAEDFSEIFFIDVDSYQTPSFPAVALMESVRDRQSAVFTVNSDWFSFAVVSFQLFVGIHPFKGTYPPLQNLPDKEKRLEARMRANISVLHAGVTVPAACLPFDVIPPAYLEWYRAVFEEGKRLPPPATAQATLKFVAPSVEYHAGSQHFEITELREFDSEIIWHDELITITQQSIYFGGKVYPKPPREVKAIITPRMRHLVVAYVDGAQVRFCDLTAGRELATDVTGQELMLSNGRCYVRQKDKLCEIEFIELPHNTLLSIKLGGNVMMNATQMFNGVALQSLLGTYYASVLPRPGVHHQVRLHELDGYGIVEAKLYRHVLIVVGAKAGRYDKLIFRFAADFSDHDVRVVPDVTLTSINFTVLDSGVALHLTDEDELEIFSGVKGGTQVKVLSDRAVLNDVKLFHTGARALIARGSKLYSLKMRQP